MSEYDQYGNMIMNHSKRRQTMKNYMMINGKKIEISDETADNLEAEFSPKTYSIGDRFVGDSEKRILAKLPDNGGVSLIDLSTGWPWASPVKVKNEISITEHEFKGIETHGKFTRYWDNAKQTNV